MSVRDSEYPAYMIVDDTDMPKTGRKGEWKALLSTDTVLTPYKAYQIYSMRWSIEVLPRVQVPSLPGKMPVHGLRAADSLNVAQYAAIQLIVMRQAVRVT